MGDFKRDRSGGGKGGRGFGGGYNSGRPGFGRKGGGGGGDRPQMFQAVCDDCGEQCEVPFRPSGEKPVYCRDCFNNGGSEKKFEPRRNDSFRDNRERENRWEKPRNNRWENPKETARDDSKEQFEILNAKLDKLLKLVTPVINVSKEMQARVESDKKAEMEVAEAPKVKKAKKSKK